VIVVTGPSGNVGRELTERLAAREDGEPYRVLTHKADVPLAANGEAVHFSYADRSTWPAALEGATRLFLLFPLPHPRTARTWMEPFVEAAAEAGVQHVVYLTVPGADHRKRIPHWRTERAIERTGMDHTFLRAAYFMQNLHRKISMHGVDVVDHDEVYIPAGKGLTTFFDARDAAEIALEILEDPAPHAGRSYLLAGPETVGFDAMAGALGDALGRPITYTSPSFPAFWKRMRPRVRWDALFFMTGVYTLARRGRNVVQEHDTARLLGRQPTDLTRWAQDSAWRFEQRAWT
jgi:uncharacterized protein YbjT (DUF2867 family)